MFSQSDWLSPFCKKAAKLVVDNMKNVLKIGEKSSQNGVGKQSFFEVGFRACFGRVLGPFWQPFRLPNSSKMAPKIDAKTTWKKEAEGRGQEGVDNQKLPGPPHKPSALILEMKIGN